MRKSFIPGSEAGLKILSIRKWSNHPYQGYTTTRGLEDEFLRGSENNSIITFSRSIYRINRVLERLGLGVAIKDFPFLLKISRTRGMLFLATMGITELRMLLPTIKSIRGSHRLVLYVFDCWEPNWDEFDEIFQQIRPFALCFAFKKTMEHFAKRYENCWFMPQSVNDQYFFDRNLKKERLFMQMGRRTEPLHKMVLNYLSQNQLENVPENYVYAKDNVLGRAQWESIFPDTTVLAQEINKTWFFLAAPRDVMNRKQTGNVSEVTARFYEAMACKTLILGIKPRDSFDELFPYPDAMIEVNDDNFSACVEKYLAHPEEYQKVVDKNYQYVMEHHRWKNRYEDLVQKLKMAGYDLQ